MSEKAYGIIGTIIIHNIILLILLMCFYIMPARSLQEGAILINFGESLSAGGLEEPAITEAPASAPETRSQPQSSSEGLLTQDHEEAPVVNKTGTSTTSRQTTPAPETVKPVETPPQVNQRAMYGNQRTSSASGAASSGTSTSEGIYQGQGNMGAATGAADADNYTEGLGGSSIGFSLSGRSTVFLQKPEFRTYAEGAIVVEITVDRNGNVIKATPGVRGSTIVDDVLYAAVTKAAMESKFNVKGDAPERQIGTITYHFRLQ